MLTKPFCSAPAHPPFLKVAGPCGNRNDISRHIKCREIFYRFKNREILKPDFQASAAVYRSSSLFLDVTQP